MSKKAKQQMAKARQKGLTPLDLLQIKETARKEAMKYEAEWTEKAFLTMLAIPLNVLVSDYWKKSARKRAPKFINDVISLYESYQNGAVTDNDLREFLKEYAGLNFEEVKK